MSKSSWLIKFYWGVLVFLQTFKNDVLPLTVISTDSFEWTLTNLNGSISVEGTVPGGVYTDLMNGGILNEGDFYYRYNDLQYRWVSYEDWVYATTFEIPESVMENDRVAFEFYGLDTSVDIAVNDNVVFSSDNMFSRVLVDVKECINSSEPVNLSIHFHSPVKYAEEYYEAYYDTYGYYVLPSCVNEAFKGECHANHIRKMQSSFAWDWGPAFPNMGIWKPWRIVGWSSIKLNNIMVETVPLHNLPEYYDPDFPTDWVVYFKVFFDFGCTAQAFNGTFEVFFEGQLLYYEDNVRISSDDFQDEQGFFENFFVIEDSFMHLSTWWPNGYGSQQLYSIRARFMTTNTPEPEESSLEVQIGFRTVELDQMFVNISNPELGRYYKIKVNKVEMFMRGSNWIPAHVLPELVTSEYIRRLLTDAKDTHQNCIRVWGGGIYESDEFYKIADELGILIWQDMMFACNMYPADEDFLSSVKKEVKSQVQRLQHHPSLLLWSTNNENELALSWNWYGTKDNYEEYKKDYVALYVNTIRETIQQLDPSRPVMVSSPSNGIVSEEAGYVADFPVSRRYGDVHYYMYFINGWNYRSYFASRFTSEFGFQSFPSYATMKPVMDEEDLEIGSPMMEHRQHHPNGQQQLESQVKEHFDYDQNTSSFRDYLYLVQLHQAIAVKTETEFYRRMRDTLNKDGSGLTMGALYWQLNDIWQGASWSSIEYGGRWKILHYFVKNFFNPLIVVPWIQNNKLKVTIVSDLPRDIEISKLEPFYLQLTISLYTEEPQSAFSYQIDYKIKSESAVLALDLDLENDLNMTYTCGGNMDREKPLSNCYVTTTLKNSTGYAQAPTNFLLLGEPKDAYLPPVRFLIGLERFSNTSVEVFITADRVAMFVFLESPFEGVFSDNGFIIPWNYEMKVYFYGREGIPLDEFRETLEISYLTNSYDDDANDEDFFLH